MSIDLNQCDKLCWDCIAKYSQKHRLHKGDSFQIGCRGIPNEYISDHILSTVEKPELAVAAFDPVTWASKYLDWHCLDPEGEHWQRKTLEGSLGQIDEYDEERAAQGKSPLNRPYQEQMLRCTSKFKVFRCGRQLGKTDCLCVAILHKIFNEKNFVVEVLTPFQSQIDLIWRRLWELISDNPQLVNSVARKVKAPYYALELKNGSTVLGFTAGTKSKAEAGAARGQHANMLVFDEADYLSPADVESTLASIINFPNATVWMSSTPTGRREKFWEVCNDDEWREFHFKSSENPNWNEDLERSFRKIYTEIGYKHEAEADFGEQEEGVYQIGYVEMAQSEFDYGDIPQRANWVYSIGVDWNDPAVGTTIAIVGYDPVERVFHLVDTHVVQRARWTQLSACQKIADLNRVWNPRWIYVDKGHGGTQIEVLHQFGYAARADKQKGSSHPDSRLADVVGYGFGESIEITDPFTKEPIKKQAKAFMVENSVRRFETQTIRYPRKDKLFTKSLLGYIIKRISMSGNPVYEAQNEQVGDHMLDAVNLALVAFTLEDSELGNPKFSSQIAFAGKLSGEDHEDIQSAADTRNLHRPPGGRAAAESPLGMPNMPAANTTRGNQSNVWSWPGFLRDEPPPTRSGFRQSVQRRPGPPTRSKF
jgi:hypothetical protein